MPDGLPGQVKHPSDSKRCGYSTDYFDINEQEIGKWTLLHHELGKHRFSIPLDKVVHLPKLPHPIGINQYKLDLVINPGPDYKVHKVQAKGQDAYDFDTAAGEEVQLLKDDKPIIIKNVALAAKSNPEAIKVELMPKDGGKPRVFYIPLKRIDSFPEAINLSGDKIFSEAIHDNDVGNKVNDEKLERSLYFWGDSTKTEISCYGHVTHALRHGIILWYGDKWQTKDGVRRAYEPYFGNDTFLAQADGLINLGWKIKYLSHDDTLSGGNDNLIVQRFGIDPADRIFDITGKALNFPKGSILVRTTGTHVAVLINGKAQEAHWRAVKDAIYERKTIQDFIPNWGFVVIPPEG